MFLSSLDIGIEVRYVLKPSGSWNQIHFDSIPAVLSPK